MHRYDLVLYDCDGTLYDTFPGLRANFENTLKEMGRDPMPDSFNWRLCIGPPLEDIFPRLLGVPEELVDEACRIYRANYRTVAAPLCRLFDGMEESCERLHAAGIKLGVASSKHQRSLATTMEHDNIRLLFSVIMGPSDEDPLLTKTAAILNAAQATGVPADRILMVGDTWYDAEGALQAGMDFCSVSWGYAAEGDFDSWPRVLAADRPSDITDFVING